MTLAAAGCGNDVDIAPPRSYVSHRVIRPENMAPPPIVVNDAPVGRDYSDADSNDPLAPPQDEDNSAPVPDIGDGDTLADGPKMPTGHSHWIRGMIRGATVSIRVNSILLGDFSAPIDRDITRFCHPGFNTIDFNYVPASDDSSSVLLQVVESEHTPAIPPLITYHRSGDGSAARTGAPDVVAHDNESDHFNAR